MADIKKVARSQTEQHEVTSALKKAVSENLKFAFPNCSVQISEGQLSAEELEPFAVKVKITFTAQIMPRTEKTPD